MKSRLAVKGGTPVIADREEHDWIFKWPIVTAEDESAVLDVLRRGAMSGTDITRKFEAEFALWLGVSYALGCCNGTASLQEAMWACGVGAGDEVICPSMTYWASCTAALALGATVHFADIDPETLCIDPKDIEHRICSRTRAIIVVHYAGYPCDMDAIMRIAGKHGVKVIEDVSHAQGALYKGRMTGTIGNVSGMSMMSGKAFAIGEAGMLATGDREIFERAMLFGQYERLAASRYAKASETVSNPKFSDFVGLPVAGVKHRMNQTCSAMGRVQLKYYPQRIAEIQKAMNYFWDLLEGVPGIRAHRPPKDSGSTMGGWYLPRGIYRSEELGGLSCAQFCKAVWEEGAPSGTGANTPLHNFRLFHDFDFFHQGKPTVLAFGQRDVRQTNRDLPVSARIAEIAFGIPWFKHFEPGIIEKYAECYRKVAENHHELLS